MDEDDRPESSESPPNPWGTPDDTAAPPSQPQVPPPPSWEGAPQPPNPQWGPPSGATPPQNPGWGQPQVFGYPSGYHPQENEPQAIVALVLSIASFVVCPIITAIAALIVASSAIKNIEASGGAKAGVGMVQAARIISIINLVLMALLAGFLIVLIIIAAVTDTGTY
ncbi:MAG: hypothetical protein ACSLFB_03525 [Acidimicrobiales bacterium]